MSTLSTSETRLYSALGEPAPTASQEPLTLTLFGPMQVRVGGQPLLPLRSRKSLYLLALLTLRHGRPVEREWLAGTLWPDVDSAQALANMRPALSALRDALGGEGTRIQSPNRRTLLLDLTGTDVDLLAFDAAVTGGAQSAALERAAALYRGPLLEGCAEEWVFQDRDTRAQAVLRALQTLATSAQETGNHETAAGWWRRAVTLDPLWEAARRGLMMTLVGRGDTNAALRVYREFSAALQSNDPRAGPDAETTALYRRLRDDVRQKAAASATASGSDATDAAPPVPFGYLPYTPNELVGREDERLEVAERLRRSRLVTLTGPGGIGKTRLAAAIAGDVVRGYPDGVWLVSLESLRAGEAGEEGQPVVQQLASVLGIKAGMGRPLLITVTEWLRRKRLLLVLDNCEHLLDATAQVVAPILRECLGVRILTTSRETLGVSGETSWSIPALAVPDPERLPDGKTALARAVTGYDSVHLFVERVQTVNQNFALTSENARHIAILCARLAGVPLAIELAAARAGALTPAQILAQFDSRPLDALASHQRDIAPRHRTLRATLEWSYSLLPTDAQAFLARMSMFRGGWALEAAQAVSPDADAVEMLTLLRNASLVNVTETDKGSRFSLLETVRQFAAEELEYSGQQDHVRKCHARYYWQWMVEAYQEPHRHRFFTVMEREYANITAALVGAHEAGDEATLLPLCHDLVGFWEHTGRLGECRYWMEMVANRLRIFENREGTTDLSSLSIVPLTPEQKRFLFAQASLLTSLGEFEGAADPMLRVYNDFRARNPVEGRTILFNAAVSLLSVDLRRSLTLLEQCLPLERAASDDGRGNPVILSQLAVVARLAGQEEKARAYLSEALEVCRGREERDAHGYARALWSAGLVSFSEGDLPLALGRFEEAASLARRLCIPILETYALCGLVSIARETGNREQGKILLTEATMAAGSEPAMRLGAILRKERIEHLLADGSLMEADILIREALRILQGKARSTRMFHYPLLILQADTSLSGRVETYGSERAARLLGAAHQVSARLGLVVPDRAEQKRAARLQDILTERLGPECLAAEEAAGAALDDEAALEFALTPV